MKQDATKEGIGRKLIAARKVQLVDPTKAKAKQMKALQGKGKSKKPPETEEEKAARLEAEAVAAKEAARMREEAAR